MNRIGYRARRLAQRRDRIVLGAHAPFFLNYFLFRFEVGIAQKSVGHSVRFQFELDADLFAAHGREVDGHV
jgi:hypothetical protein